MCFIQEQIDLFGKNKRLEPDTFVQNFRSHYSNLSSFASSISRFKSELGKKHHPPESFLAQLKPTGEEICQVHARSKQRLTEKCQNSITLKNCGDNLIVYFRSCLESEKLGNLFMGIQAMTGFRQVEVIARGRLEHPKLNHRTDEIYWSTAKGIVKKKGMEFAHERPLLARREIVQKAMERLRNLHFAEMQNWVDNAEVSRKCCNKINRAISSAWPFPEIRRITSHFFRSFYVACTYHYFNEKNSLASRASNVLGHDGLETSHPYSGLLITGFGSLSFDSERQLVGMQRLTI